MSILKLFKKPSERKNFFDNYMSKLKRKARNRRYYLKHRDEILQKRKDYYLINGK